MTLLCKAARGKRRFSPSGTFVLNVAYQERMLTRTLPRLVIFFVATYLISWYAWILHHFGWSQETGIFPLGPIIAAAVVSAFSGWNGFKSWLSRLFRFRVGWRWYALVIGLPIAIDAASAFVNLALGAHTVPLDADHSISGLPARFVFIFVLIGLGEEGGWRGFALPELRTKFGPAVASLILGALWAVWHLPLFGVEFSLQILPAFLLSLFSATFVITWIADRAGDTVVLPALLHTVVNHGGRRTGIPDVQGSRCDPAVVDLRRRLGDDSDGSGE